MEKEIKIALVIKTNGLEYDDRVRKEILSVMKLYPIVKFKIFAMLPNNTEYEDITDYGVPFKAIYMPSREKYPAGKKILKKTYEFYKVLKKYLEDFDAVWCGDYHSVAIALFCRDKPVLWDLHELPSMLLSSGLKRMVLRYVFSNCKVVLHANPQRIEYLASMGCIKDRSKHFALRNFPNFQNIVPEYDEKYNAFIAWKKGRSCVYLQGLTNESRADVESVNAVLSYPDIVAVVVGGFQEKSKAQLIEKWGKEEIERRLYFVGQIPQAKIPQYVSNCFTTLVFYKNVRPNNWYCEANRFYQAVILGLPVVVGNNPPLKELVEKYGFGVVVNTDGSDISEIIIGLQKVIYQRSKYIESIAKNKHLLTWERQEWILKDVVKKLIE